MPADRLSALVIRVVLPLALMSGCKRQPRAPALSDEPVYQNAAEGFRFLAPPGWSQRAKANLPPGELGKERLLVQYRRLTEALVASLEVTACDRETAADLDALLSGPSFGIQQWQRAEPPEKVQVGALAAERHVFSVPRDKERLIKEVVVFPRGERVYLFTGLYYASDMPARDQLRAAVASTIWRE
jgi:hypothetical protein